MITLREAALEHVCLEDLVGALADAELPPDEELAVQEHLRRCGRCVREMFLQWDLCRELEREPRLAASAALRERIEQIGSAPRRRLALPWSRRG